MQDQKTSPTTDPGFKLPGQTQPTTPQDPMPKTAPDTANQPVEIAPGGATNASAAPLRDTSARDLAIGGAILAGVVGVFFFLGNAYRHPLGGGRGSPSSARRARGAGVGGGGFFSLP